MPNQELTPNPSSNRQLLPRRRRNWSIVILYSASLVTLVYFATSGWDYYATPLIERPHHDSYWTLKPGGQLGKAFGIIGTSLMILMLLYSLRRRWSMIAKVGKLATWLDLHIFCGIIGPLFIVLHSSFKVTGLVALSFWSMVLVAISGMVGRYLYVQIPRRRSGDEMNLAEVEIRYRKLNEALSKEFGIAEADLAKIQQVALAEVKPQQGLLRTLVTLPFATAQVRWRIRALSHKFSSVPGHRLTRALEEQAVLSRRIAMWARIHELFHYWHVLHLPFALVMYIFAAAHIVVATVTGYGFN